MDTKKLKQKILDLAIHGKLVPQDPKDEPASELLQRIRAEKERLIKEGKIKKSRKRKNNEQQEDRKHVPFQVPDGWEWCSIIDVAETQLGKTLDKNKDRGEEKEYLCAINIQWASFNLSTIKKFRLESKEFEKYSVKQGDLLICEGGDVGKAAIWSYDKEMYYQNALHRVRFFQGIQASFSYTL